MGISLKGPHSTIFQFWNGKKWQVQPSQSGELAGVSVGSAAEVWAVGDVSSGAVTRTLFVHCGPPTAPARHACYPAIVPLPPPSRHGQRAWR